MTSYCLRAASASARRASTVESSSSRWVTSRKLLTRPQIDRPQPLRHRIPLEHAPVLETEDVVHLAFVVAGQLHHRGDERIGVHELIADAVTQLANVRAGTDLRREAPHREKTLIEGRHLPAPIADQDAVGRRLERRRQRGDRVFELLRRPPAIGHVPAAPDQARRLAAVGDHLAARVQHAHLAVGTADAVVVDEGRDVLDRLPDHRLGVLDILRIDARQKAFVARDEVGAVDGVDVEQLVGPVDVIVRDVPLPAADVRDALGLGQPRLAGDHRLLGPLPGRHVHARSDDVRDRGCSGRAAG